MSAVIVVWDDQQGVCCPMTFDDECEGAICCGSGPVALFSDRKQALRAIRISKAFAKLCETQGKPANADFLGDAAKCIQIRPIDRAGIQSK